MGFVEVADRIPAGSHRGLDRVPGAMSWWSHRKMRKLVTAYVDGEIDAVGAAQVAAHLEQCWGCNSDVEQLRLIKASLGNLRARRPAAVAVPRLRRWANGLRP